MKANLPLLFRVLLFVALLTFVAHAADSPPRLSKKAKRAVASEESPVALAARMEKGSTLLNAGNFLEAAAEYRAVYGIQKRILGPKHEDTEHSGNSLSSAIWFRMDKVLSVFHEWEHHGMEDEMERAEKELRVILRTFQSDFGPNDRSTLNCRFELGNALAQQRKYAEAEKEFRAILAICTRTLGPEDSITLYRRLRLARLLKKMGKLAEAEREFRALLAIETRQSDFDYYFPGRHHEFAETLEAQGKGIEAGKEYRAAAAIYGKRIDDSRNFRFVDEYENSLTALARALYAEGKYAEAEEAYRDILTIAECLSPNGFPDIAVIHNALGLTLQAQGKNAEAEQVFRNLIQIAEGFFVPDAADTLIIRRNLAFALNSQGKYVEAEKEERAVLAARERVLYRWNPQILDSCYSLAMCLADQGKKDEALPFARRAVLGYEKVWSPRHPLTQGAQKFLKGLEKK